MNWQVRLSKQETTVNITLMWDYGVIGPFFDVKISSNEIKKISDVIRKEVKKKVDTRINLDMRCCCTFWSCCKI